MSHLLHLYINYVMISPIRLESLRSFTIKYLTMSEKGSQALWFEIVNDLTQAIQNYQKK